MWTVDFITNILTLGESVSHMHVTLSMFSALVHASAAFIIRHWDPLIGKSGLFTSGTSILCSDAVTDNTSPQLLSELNI